MTKAKSSTSKGKTDRAKSKGKTEKTASKAAPKNVKGAVEKTKATAKNAQPKKAAGDRTPEPVAAQGGATAKTPVPGPAPEDLHRMIAEAAYFRALARGFERGDALGDWLAAEQEISRTLSARTGRGPTL